jgi:ABC-2 type transport system permease protein
MSRTTILEALRAEWTKLWTLSSTAWLVAGAAVVTIGLSGALVAATSYHPGTFQDVPKLALTGIDLGQAVVAVLAISVVANEYSSGMIRVTLTAIPRRSVLLGTKAALVVVLAGAAGVVAAGGSLLVGRLVLPGAGFTAAHGYRWGRARRCEQRSDPCSTWHSSRC